MPEPDEFRVKFQHQGSDYDLRLVKGEKSDYSVTINGVRYAVLGDKDKLKTACEILESISLNSVLSSEDLKQKLSVRKDLSFPVQKTVDVSTTTFQGMGAAAAAAGATALMAQVEVKGVAASRAVRETQIREAAETLSRELKEFASKTIKEKGLGQGALLVQVVGVKGYEQPMVFGNRSVNDPTPVDEHSVGRTGSGAKLWAGLLTKILTKKYGKRFQLSDGLGKFASQDVLRKFGKIAPDGRVEVDPKLAERITVEGLICMMAGLEYEMPPIDDNSESTLDQFLRGQEVGEGSILMLYNPEDKVNFYTNNICLIAYPIEKAYKKVLAEDLITKHQLNPNQTLRELLPQLEVHRKECQEKIRKTEEEIKRLRTQQGLAKEIAPHESRLALLRTDLAKLKIPDAALDITLKDLLECDTAYTKPPSSVYVYDTLDLFLMPSNNHHVDYEEIMKRELLRPMGMDQSGFRNVPGAHMDVTYENPDTHKDESRSPPLGHISWHAASFGRTTLTDSAKLARGLSDPRGLVGKDKGVLLSPEELEDVFRAHGHYEGWGLGGAELTCGGRVVDKGGSFNQDQYSFWVDRDSGVGMVAMCNCGRRPDDSLNAFKERVEHVNYPHAKAVVKDKEGTPLGIGLDFFFAHPLKREDVHKVFEGSRGRVALLFDYERAQKGFIHWSGTPLEVEKQADGSFRVITAGRFKDVEIRKFTAKSGKEYLSLSGTSFVEVPKNLPSEADKKHAESEYTNFSGTYVNKERPDWGVLEFRVFDDGKGNRVLAAGEGGKPDSEFVPQGIVKVEANSIMFNGHDRQPPDKIFRFVRESEHAPWRLQVLDYVSKTTRPPIEERPKT